MLLRIIDFGITDELKQLGISRIAKEAKTIVIHYQGIPIRFDVLKDWTKTIASFEKVSKDIITDNKIIQKVSVCLSENWLKLCGYDHQNNDTISNNGNDKGNSKEDHATEKEHNNTADNNIIPDPNSDKIPDKDYAEFVISTSKKTVKQEDVLVKQILYTGLSAYTHDPINLGILAPTAEGKTYPVIQTLKPFPKEDVWLIGSMSTKLLVRQKGELVDQYNQPIKSQIKELKQQIEEQEGDKESLKEKLEELYENARSLIDLKDKILVFLEPPQHELWNLLKPILSHDSEIEFPYVDKTERGFQSKRVVVRGWPACIFCSAKDESNWPAWSEIVNRFLITSPNMIPEKYLQSNLLIAQRKGLPDLLQQKLIVSNEEILLAKRCVLYLKQEIQKLSSNKQNPLWIPYSQILGEILPSEKGTDTRITKRIFSFLNIIALAKAHLRLKLMYGQETLIIASLEDLGEVLHITQNINGIPTYKMKFFIEIFLPLYKSKINLGPDEKDTNEETRIAVTTRELCDYMKEKIGKEIDTDNLKKKYLNELHNNGLIGEEISLIDKRQKIYYPLVGPSTAEDSGNNEKISNYTNPGTFDNFLQYSKINIPENCKMIPEEWLIYEILGLAKCRIDLDNFKGYLADFLNSAENFKFFDKEGRRLTIRQFISEYEKNQRLSRYFVKRTFNNFDNKIFGNIKHIEYINTKGYEKLPNVDKFVQFDNWMTVAKQNKNNNILYSQAILLKNITSATNQSSAEDSNIKPISLTTNHTASQNFKSPSNHQQVVPAAENRQQIEEKDSLQGGIEGTDGTHTEEKLRQIEDTIAQKNAHVEPSNKNSSEESSIKKANFTSQNDEKSYESSNNVSQASQVIETQHSTTSGSPTTDQNYQDRILPLSKELIFSKNNYEKSIISFSIKRSTEDVIPVKEVIINGIPPISCIFCNNFRTSIELDLKIHLYDNHRMELVKLPIGKGSMEHRIDYAVEECKKRIVSRYDG